MKCQNMRFWESYQDLPLPAFNTKHYSNHLNMFFCKNNVISEHWNVRSWDFGNCTTRLTLAPESIFCYTNDEETFNSWFHDNNLYYQSIFWNWKKTSKKLTKGNCPVGNSTKYLVFPASYTKGWVGGAQYYEQERSVQFSMNWPLPRTVFYDTRRRRTECREKKSIMLVISCNEWKQVAMCRF